MWGHQVVAHLSPDEAKESSMNAVDGHGVPVRHFGVILSMEEWEALAERVKKASLISSLNPIFVLKGKQVSRQLCSFWIRVEMRWNSRRLLIKAKYLLPKLTIGSVDQL